MTEIAENFVNNNKNTLDLIINSAYYHCYNINYNLYYWQDDLKSAAWARLIKKLNYVVNKFELNKTSTISVGLRWYLYKLAYHEMLQYIEKIIKRNSDNIIRNIFKTSNLRTGQIIPLDDKYVDYNNYNISDDRLIVKTEILNFLNNLKHVSRFSKNERLFIELLKEIAFSGAYITTVKNRQTLIDVLENDNRLKHLKRKTMEIYLSRLTKLFKEVNNG